ncbi:hypothetical protein HC235_08235 [Pyrobaculum arsenaticum]|uniref:Uncharacterized protein n=1 Tax=Pyrobaculum arsenaticum TaxID=121277 RepID=A0A7L4PD10_9CREN|nr:hypothetical protein [Pyrobaculum arsenaticum]
MPQFTTVIERLVSVDVTSGALRTSADQATLVGGFPTTSSPQGATQVSNAPPLHLSNAQLQVYP